MPDNCERYKGLMMGLMDNELTTKEAVDLNSHMTHCKSCRDEYEELKKSSSSLKGLTYNEPRDVELEGIWKAPYSGLAKNIGLIMIIAGWLAIVIFSLVEILQAGSEHFIPKISTALIVTGFIILLFVVIRDRIKTYKSDPYKEVER